MFSVGDLVECICQGDWCIHQYGPLLGRITVTEMHWLQRFDGASGDDRDGRELTQFVEVVWEQWPNDRIKTFPNLDNLTSWRMRLRSAHSQFIELFL